MKSLYASLVSCKKEEEVKAEFCKFFKMKINALKAIDHYTSGTLFEFKYDLNFRNAANVAHVLAQTMYYARLLKYSLTKYPLSPFICVVDKCQKIFPSATCFQYNYLEDDIATLAGNLDFGSPRKMPAKLVEDLKNPKLKWIVFINPPFATANSAGAETGKESKGGVSMTPCARG